MRLIHSLYSKLKANDFVHSVAILVTGTALSQTIIVALTPLLTRLYTPEDFGVLSVYTSLVFTVAIITSLHYEVAIPLPKDEKEGLNLLGLSLLILLGNVFLSILIIAIFKQSIVDLFNTVGLNKIINFLPYSILGFGLFKIFQHWLLRKEDYSNITKGQVRMNLSQAFSQTSLGFIPKLLGGLIVGEVIGRIVGGVGMGVTSWKDIKHKKHFITWQNMRKIAVRYQRFPLVASWSSLMGGLTQHLPALFVAFALGAKAAGWYLIANRILALPDALLGYSVKQVYLAKSAKVMHESFTQFTALFWNTVKKMSLISFLIYLLIAVLAPIVFPFVFGPGWGEAGTFVQSMSILFFCQVIVGPISSIFTLLEEQYMGALSEFLRLVVLIIGMVIAYIFFEEPWQVIIVISLAGALGFIILGFFSWVVLIRGQIRHKEGRDVNDEFIYKKS